jgi:hypothetical protein
MDTSIVIEYMKLPVVNGCQQFVYRAPAEARMKWDIASFPVTDLEIMSMEDILIDMLCVRFDTKNLQLVECLLCTIGLVHGCRYA